MPGFSRLLLSSALTVLVASAAAARQADAPATPSGAPAVTASAAGGRVRFTAPPETRGLRLEVYGEGGGLLADVSRPGSVLVWAASGAGGAALPDGAYRLVLTATSVSGASVRRAGVLQMSGGEALLRVEAGASTQPPASDVQGSGEDVLPLAVVGEEASPAVTSVAHDGADGLLVRGRGALSFRLGDFFSGSEREQMRLTEDGRLGLGTDKPEATLDVAGTIRASRGLVFSDGTALTSATGRAQKLSADGTPEPLAGGTGTPGMLTKWLDGAGTLTDSTFLEDASGNVFNFTGTRVVVGGQQPFFEAQRNSAGDILQRFWNTGTGGAKLRYVAGTGATSQIQLTDGLEWLSSIAGNNSIGLEFRVRPTGSTNSEAQLDASAVMTLARSGNVGVGIAAPAAKLDVAGNINASQPYSLNGQTVLNVSGTDNVGTPAVNTFAGVGAGTNITSGFSNSFFGRNAGFLTTTGTFNAFFGKDAGLKNTSGFSNVFVGSAAGSSNTTAAHGTFVGTASGFSNTTGTHNSFFGSSSGDSTTTGTFNAFFGYNAGSVNETGGFNTSVGAFADVGNTALTNATAVGARAMVTQSDSLVLGSVSGVNAAPTTVKVGIGTTAPAERLHVVGNGLFTGNLTVGGALNTSGAVSLFGLRTEATSDSPNVVGGFSGNAVTAGVIGATIAGGGQDGFISNNRVTDAFATVGGGRGNQAGDGITNHDGGILATVGGGNFNTASGIFSTISGGSLNKAGGYASVVPGGHSNFAMGDHSFAAGYRAKANHAGAFVWADSFENDFLSTGANQFLIRASGGVGVNTNAPLAPLDVRGDIFAGLSAPPSHGFGPTNGLYVANDGGDAANSFRVDGSANMLFLVANSGAGAASGAGIVFRTGTAAGGEADRVAILPDGTVKLNVLGAAGSTQLCLNASNIISGCSSSMRYKENVTPFTEGLGLLRRLRPVTFDWKAGGGRDLGFVAEEVGAVEPLLVTRNAAGEVEGVKYDRVGAVLVNAVKEQQGQIERQHQTIAELERQNALLRTQGAQQAARLDAQEARLRALEEALKSAPSRRAGARRKRARARRTEGVGRPRRCQSRTDGRGRCLVEKNRRPAHPLRRRQRGGSRRREAVAAGPHGGRDARSPARHTRDLSDAPVPLAPREGFGGRVLRRLHGHLREAFAPARTPVRQAGRV